MIDALSDFQSEHPERFLFGASVAPFAKSLDYPEEEWESDFQKMKELNITAVRCYVAWDRVEQKEGELDFHAYDHLCDLGLKYGIGIILNLGGVFSCLTGVYPPQWLVRKYGCKPPKPTPTAVAENASPRISICLDNPLYRRKAFAFMETVVKRYAENRAVIGWMSWNEPALPFCYCQDTQKRFRKWLQDKYNGNLAELNRVWGTEFPINYESWEEVQAPAGFGFTGGGLNAWRDWHLFTHWRLADAMGAIRDIVHKFDALQRPVTSNLVYSLAYYRHTMANLNLDMAGGALDVVGLSFYTRAHTGDTFDPLHKAYCLSRYRSVSREPSRRMWILETEAGPNVRQITEPQRKLNHWMALAHNVKCFLLWIYRCRYSDNQVGNFNMMAWDGSVTNRARYNGEFSKMLQSHGRLLNNVSVGRTAAVFAPELQSILTLATHGGGLVPNLESAAKELEVCTRSLKGAYKFLWDRNIPADFISEWNLRDMNQYKLILLPMTENMTPEWAEAIRQYVEQGGTVIAESPFAFKDGDNFLHGRAPIFGLEEVFGAWTNDREGRESAPKMVFDNGGTADVFFYWHEWHLAGAQVLAKYETGTPAIVANRYGKGLAVMAGTEIFRQYFSEPQEATTALLERLATEAGATPTARVLVNGDDSAGGLVEVAKLDGTEGTVYIILNHNEEERLVEIFLKDADGLTDLETGRPFDGKAFVMPPLGGRALYRENVRK